MIMVFKVRTVLRMLQRLSPSTNLQFTRIFEAIGTPAEKHKDLLAKIAANDSAAISVLPVLQVFWSDWGSPARLTEVLEMLGRSRATTEDRASGTQAATL